MSASVAASNGSACFPLVAKVLEGVQQRGRGVAGIPAAAALNGGAPAAPAVGAGAVRLGQGLKTRGQGFDLEGIDQRLSLGPVATGHEGVVGQFKVDAGGPQRVGPPLRLVEIHLPAKGQPGRHAHVAQVQRLVEEVKAVVRTTTADELEAGAAGFPVVPGLETFARFHRREDMDQAGMAPVFFQDSRHALFLAQAFAFEGFDFQSGLAGQEEGGVAHLLAKGFGEDFQIKAADVQVMESKGHGLGMGKLHQSAGEDEPVVATQNPVDLIRVAVEELDLRSRVARTFAFMLPLLHKLLVPATPATPG
jgi:hypothetical protein